MRAAMAGRLVQFNAKVGETLAAGAEVLVLEAMKMQHGIHLEGAACVSALCVAAGDFVNEGQLLLLLSPREEEAAGGSVL